MACHTMPLLPPPLPPLQDFIFDLHDSMRRSQVLDELERLYNDTFKTLSEAYFKQVGLGLG